MPGWGISPSPQHRRLAHAGPPQEKNALSGSHEVLDDANGTEDCPADAAGETDDLALAVTDARDAVQGTLDASAVVSSELADARNDRVDLLLCDLFVTEDDLFPGIPRLWHASEIEDDLQQLEVIRAAADSIGDMAG